MQKHFLSNEEVLREILEGSDDEADVISELNSSAPG